MTVTLYLFRDAGLKAKVVRGLTMQRACAMGEAWVRHGLGPGYAIV
jgi:hypothetical protein